MNRAYSMAGFILGALLFVSFLGIVVSEPFPIHTFLHDELVPKQPLTEIGKAVSGFLWEYRGFDVLIQALLLLVTSICCLALIWEERR